MNIRRMSESDLMSLYGTLSDPVVMKYIEEPHTLEKTKENTLFMGVQTL